MATMIRLAFLCLGLAVCLPRAADAIATQGRFANATEQRLFILEEDIREKPGTGDRIDVQVYAIIVNACRFCAETYVFVETQLHRGTALGAFECNYQFGPLATFSNGLKDFLCARESETGRVTRYHLKYDGARYVREQVGR